MPVDGGDLIAPYDDVVGCDQLAPFPRSVSTVGEALLLSAALLVLQLERLAKSALRVLRDMR